MPDIREGILAQILVIITNYVDRVRRNSDDLSAKEGTAGVLSDGDETITDIPIRKNSRGDPRILLDLVQMTPSITLIVGGNTENIGTMLNGLRATVMPALINDETLVSLVGPDGEIRYTGATVETQAGENREGRLTLDMRFTYVLRVNDLGS